MTLYDAWRVQRKDFGPDWQCGDCGMKFPAAAFEVNWRETSDAHTKIVASGYWRCCRVCREIREMKSGGSSSSHKAYTCARCKQHREIFCFPDDSNVCKACHLHENFQYIICSSCCKPNLEKTMHCPDGSGKMQLCEACADKKFYIHVLYVRAPRRWTLFGQIKEI